MVQAESINVEERDAVAIELDVPLSGLKPGSYVCQLNVIDDAAGSFAFPRFAVLVASRRHRRRSTPPQRNPRQRRPSNNAAWPRPLPHFAHRRRVNRSARVTSRNDSHQEDRADNGDQCACR